MADNDDLRQWYHERLKKSGYRITSNREAVLGLLAEHEEHMSAEEIYIKLRPVCTGIGLASIYRTLEILVNLGLVVKFDFGQGKAKYELAEYERGKKHHHHLVCRSCGLVIDYKDFSDEELKLLEKTEERLHRKYKFKVINHLVQFYGVCRECNNAGRENSYKKFQA